MGPLSGVRVIEISGIGPGPFCGMMLSDMGAEVISVERALTPIRADDPMQRNRHRITLDLKSSAGLSAVLALTDQADMLFEGFRPGVAERLGFGPAVCLARNPRLVYGRMTGWGQEGPLARAAGHDINYIALSGALKAIGRAGEKPVPPLNLVGDYGGGGMLLAFGLVCALFEARRSGVGQVVDAAMLDGAIALMAAFMGKDQYGPSCDDPGTHVLSGAAHCYDAYRTRDGQFISVAAMEPQFYALLVEKLGLDQALFAPYVLGSGKADAVESWPRLKQVLADTFLTRTRDEWCALLEGTDVCFAPVLSLAEAPEHAHNRARANFVKLAGRWQNAPAPRFSATPAAAPEPAVQDRDDLRGLLARWQTDPSLVEQIVATAQWEA